MAALLVIAAGEDPAHVFDTEHLETVRGRMQLSRRVKMGRLSMSIMPTQMQPKLPQAFRLHVMGRLTAIIGGRDASGQRR